MKKFTILAVTIIMIIGIVGLNIFASGGVTATPGDSKVTLSWNAPDDVNDVTYSISGGTTQELQGTTYIVKNLNNGTLYEFTIRYVGIFADGSPASGTIGTVSSMPTKATAIPSDTASTTTAPVTTASPVVTATATETPVITTAPVTTTSPVVTETSTATSTVTATNTATPTNTCSGTKYAKNDSSYNIVTINAENSKNTNISVTIGGKDVTVNQQIVKGGSAVFEQKLSNGKTFKKSFKVTEGKNVIYGQDGKSYTFWAYGKNQSIKDVKTKNLITLSDNSNSNSSGGSSVDLGEVTTTTLPSSELVTTLPKTGESSNSMLIFTLAGSILVFGGIALLIRKKLKNN